MLTRIFLQVAATWGALLVVAVIFQRRLIFFPPRGYPLTPAVAGLPFEAAVLTASDGVRLAAWWIPPPQTRRPGGVVLPRQRLQSVSPRGRGG
jgi:hypothetical protein